MPRDGRTTFRAIVKKYPGIDRERILSDLAKSSGEPGRWLAAAKDAGLLDLALEFARQGRTDPRTLSRASRDLLKKDARFSLNVGRLAMERILQGYGYDLTPPDVVDACDRFLAAAVCDMVVRRYSVSPRVLSFGHRSPGREKIEHPGLYVPPQAKPHQRLCSLGALRC